MKQLQDGAFGKMDGSAPAKVPVLLNFIEEMSSDTDSAIQPGQTRMALTEVILAQGYDNSAAYNIQGIQHEAEWNPGHT